MSVWNSCLGDVRCYLEFSVSSVLQVCRDNGIDPLHDYTNHYLYTVYPTHRPRHPLVGTRARTLLSLPARDNAGPEGHFKSVGLSTDTIVRVCPFYDPTDGGGAIWMRNLLYDPAPTAQRGFVFMLSVFSRLIHSKCMSIPRFEEVSFSYTNTGVEVC